VLKNIIANFIGRFWSIFSNFLFIPLYIKLLGFESYAIISFGLVIAGIMAVLDAGLTATLSREFARSDLSFSEKQRTFRTLETTYFGVTGIAIFLVIVFSNTIAISMVTSETYKPEEISLFIKIISIDIGFQLLNRFYLGGFMGLEKQVKANALQVAWGICRNGLVVITLLILPSLISFFVWQALSTLLFALFTGFLLRKHLKSKYLFGVERIDRNILKRNWRFAGGMLLISLVAALNTQMDKLAISKLLPIDSLGYYTLAISLSMGIIVLVNPVSIAILPRLTHLFTGDKTTEAQVLYNRVYKIVAILVFTILSSMFFFNYELIWIWTGNSELANKTSDFVPIIASAVSMLALATIPYNIAIANGYTKLNNIIGIVSLLITLPGYWLATDHFGAIGAAYVYCIVQIFITVIYIYLINRRFFNEKNILRLYIKPILLPLSMAFSVGCIFSNMPEFFSKSRIFSLIWIGFATITIFFSVLLILVPREELRQFRKQVNLFKH